MGFSVFFIRLFSVDFQVIESRIVVWKASDVPPSSVWFGNFPSLVKVEFVKVPETRFCSFGAVHICWKVFSCLLFLVWKRTKKYSKCIYASELIFCSFLLFFLVFLCVYTTAAFSARVGIFIIIVDRYFPDFLSIIGNLSCLCLKLVLKLVLRLL